MSRYSELACCLLLLVVLAVASAHPEAVTFQNCPYPNPDEPANCTIHEVRVDPCKEAAEGKPCRLKKGQPARISFDYTTNFAGENLQSRAYWATQIMDLAFMGMSTDACNATTCPATPGERRTYDIELHISKNFPIRTYDLKWKLWNEQEQECCFMFQIKLHK